MSQSRKMNATGQQVAVVVGATSKWQADGRNTLLAHGRALDDGLLGDADALHFADPSPS